MSSESSSSEKQSPTGLADLKQIGKYTISRRLGAGGMGIVYLAADSELKRTVALKVLSQDRANNPILVRRFKSEGQAAALLQHKNIVSVYEAGQADGYLFLALEYVEGIDLLEWVNQHGPLPVKRSVEIMRQATEALQHAFERNIVHRDIKPSNLMVARDGTVKLTDMGLARSIDETLDTTITRDGTTVGTVDYMAPEQASNSKAADARSDIYSLGCTWFHLLTGRPPYPEGSVTNKIAAHISSPIPDPRLIQSQIPEAVVAVIHRMLAKKKEQRYQTPAELLEDLNSPTLRWSQEAPNLLAMFGDDLDLDSTDDLYETGTPSSKETQPASSNPQQSGPKRSRSATGSPPKKANFRSAPTRHELPAEQKRDSRERLTRTPPEPAVRETHVPWGLIMGGIVIALVILIRGIIAMSFPANGHPETISPYVVGPAPDSTSPQQNPPPPGETNPENALPPNQ